MSERKIHRSAGARTGMRGAADVMTVQIHAILQHGVSVGGGIKWIAEYLFILPIIVIHAEIFSRTRTWSLGKIAIGEQELRTTVPKTNPLPMRVQ